jgi:hypothetical protein
LEKVMNTSRPTNTVGMLKRVWMTLISRPLPGKLWKYIRLPKGTKIRAEMDVEVEDISRVFAVILNTSRSPVKMSLRAVKKLSITRSKGLLTSGYEYTHVIPRSPFAELRVNFVTKNQGYMPLAKMLGPGFLIRLRRIRDHIRQSYFHPS